MGLLSRIALRNPGPISRAAGRLGSKLSRYSENVAGQPVDFDFVLQDVLSPATEQLGGKRLATGINWGWKKTNPDDWRAVFRSDLTPRQTKAVFDGTADKIASEIEARPPQLYTFSGVSGGHQRRYARDLEARLSGSGYRAHKVGDEFFLEPTPLAYLNYASRFGSPALTGAGVGAGLMSYDASR